MACIIPCKNKTDIPREKSTYLYCSILDKELSVNQKDLEISVILILTWKMM